MSAVFEGVAIGDLHLDALSNLFPVDGLHLQSLAIRRALDYASFKGLKHVVYLGDVANKPRMSYEAQTTLFDLMLDYPKLYKHVYPGNHDMSVAAGRRSAETGQLTEVTNSLRTLTHLSNRDILPNTFVYNTLSKKMLDGVPVVFAPFPAHTVETSRQCVLFAHVERKGAQRDNGSVIRSGEQCDIHSVIGHLHTHQDVGKSHYPGTLYQLSFGETLPKGFTHFKFRMSKSGKITADHQWIQTKPPYELTNVEVNHLSDLDSVVFSKHHLYKLFVSRAVELPPTFLAQRPNIVNVLGYGSQEELKILREATSAEELVYDLTEGLEDYLIQKHGATKKQAGRALVLAESLLSRMRSRSVGINVNPD